MEHVTIYCKQQNYSVNVTVAKLNSLIESNIVWLENKKYYFNISDWNNIIK